MDGLRGGREIRSHASADRDSVSRIEKVQVEDVMWSARDGTPASAAIFRSPNPFLTRGKSRQSIHKGEREESMGLPDLDLLPACTSIVGAKDLTAETADDSTA